MGFEVRRVVAGVIVGGGEPDDGLLDGKDASGLGMRHMLEQIF